MLKKISLLLFALLLLAALAVGLAWQAMHKQMLQPLPIQEEITFDVRSGLAFNQLLQQLDAKGWLQQRDLVRVYARLHPEITAIRAGEYRVQPGESLLDLLERLNRGDVIPHFFTLIEGHNFRQIRAALAADERLQQQLPGLSEADIMTRLGRPDQPAEGLFLADTYQFTRGMSDLDLLRRALLAQEQFLEAQWQARAPELPYANAYEALIMASIIEKETGVPEERAEIAGVFVRRLRLGMRLQTDPTVIYGMGESYQGRIRRADLERPTPWNTYTIAGLPPTPIAMVGREAIVAALNPLAGNTLYFVAKGDGTHHFSRTLSEHNAAVRRYQLNRRSDYRSSPGGG